MKYNEVKINSVSIDFIVRYAKLHLLIELKSHSFIDRNELWFEKDDGYRTKKTNLGIELLAAVRKSLSEYDLKEMPMKK